MEFTIGNQVQILGRQEVGIVVDLGQYRSLKGIQWVEVKWPKRRQWLLADRLREHFEGLKHGAIPSGAIVVKNPDGAMFIYGNEPDEKLFEAFVASVTRCNASA